MMIKKYILASLMAATTAAAFSLGSAADVYADNGRDRIRTDLFRAERANDHDNDADDKQVVRVVPSNSTNGTNSTNGNNGNHVSVPEPATMLLLGSALGGLALLRSRKDMD